MAETMDVGYRATGRDLFDDFSQAELSAFTATMDRVLDRIRTAGGRDGTR